MANKDEVARERAQEAIAKEGVFSALETDENSIAKSDDAFVGANEEYQNYGSDHLKPYDFAGDEAEVVKRQRDAVADDNERAKDRDNLRGYVVKPVHPTDVVKAGEKERQNDRLIREAQLKQAQEQLGADPDAVETKSAEETPATPASQE